MKIHKYKRLIQQRIAETINHWSLQSSVEEHEIHRFFHNLKGTSGTIGLNEIEKFSHAKQLLFEENSAVPCSKEEWSKHLLPLLEMFPNEAERSDFVEHSPEIEDAEIDIHASMNKRVLVIDDDVDFVTYVKEVLEKQLYPVSIALNAERGLKLFYEWKPGLILLDIVLPDKSGLYVLQQIVEKAKQEHIPIIMISGNNTIDNQIRAYRLGAMDFLAKPMETDLLIALIDNRFTMKREWQQSVIVDELTGAYNRKHFNRMMLQLIGDFNRNDNVFSTVLIDLDYFKMVNDTYGHLKGDEVLQKFVSVTQSTIRPNDILCRYGGEEFALLLPNTNSQEAMFVIERLKEQLGQHYFQSGEDRFRVTFSSGITEISAHNNQALQLVEEADQALYNGKRSGRNQIVIYTPVLAETTTCTILNVIVVDDDPLIRELVLSRFSHWKPMNTTSVRAHEFSDGMAFIQSDWYKEGEKYIILLDGSMPHLDGMEVLRRLREHYPEQHMLIVMLTARGDKSDIVKALQIGADDYVVKPFHMQELVLRIERLANRILN